MPKRTKTSVSARTAHTRQKPKPRLVSKAHLLEQDEMRAAVVAQTAAGKRRAAGARSASTAKPRG